MSLKQRKINTGGLVPLLILAPNLLLLFFPPRGEVAQNKNSLPLLIAGLEWIGRAGVLLLPFFLSLHFCRKRAMPVAIGMTFLLSINYLCWVRYSAGEQNLSDLYSSFIGIPYPLATVPSVFFILSSYLLKSRAMLLFSLLFAAGHLTATHIECLR